MADRRRRWCPRALAQEAPYSGDVMGRLITLAPQSFHHERDEDHAHGLARLAVGGHLPLLCDPQGMPLRSRCTSQSEGLQRGDHCNSIAYSTHYACAIPKTCTLLRKLVRPKPLATAICTLVYSPAAVGDWF